MPRLRRVRCVTLMVNRSDRRFQTLSPRMAARGRQTDQQNEARGNPSRPGLHLTPDKQAGYMTATEFQIASAIQPLTRAGSIYAWRITQSDANQSPWFKFPDHQGKYREFQRFRPSGPSCGRKSPVFSRVFVGIPYSTEQGILKREQRIILPEQAIFFE